jgi:hypothetical protein
MIAAPTLSAKIAVRVAFDLGELDINVLEDGQRLGGRDDRCGQQARSTARVEPRPFYPERALLARPLTLGRLSRRPLGPFVRRCRR